MWGYKSHSFKKALNAALDAPTLTEVLEHDDCLFHEAYTSDYGQHIAIKLYAYKGRIYVMRFVEAECVSWFDVTPKGDK